MTAAELYQAGRLDEAITALGDALRSDPTDVRRRTFLFELLCFAGAYDRAEKQLDVLARADNDALTGALLYRGALHAERTRQGMFAAGGMLPSSRQPAAVTGTFNGQPFRSMVDADPRIGARLEIFAAGQYTWLPLEHVSSVVMEPPRRLRDLLWAPVIVRPSEQMRELELGEMLMPVLTPFAWQHADPLVRLGRTTDLETLVDGADAPVGQKLWLIDDEEVPVLELRELVIEAQPRPAGS
jgi:type VI secretion system protein ImpE